MGQKFVPQGFADQAPKFLVHFKILLENSIHAIIYIRYQVLILLPILLNDIVTRPTAG